MSAMTIAAVRGRRQERRFIAPISRRMAALVDSRDRLRQGRFSEKRPIRSILLATQISSPTRMAALTRCMAAL